MIVKNFIARNFRNIEECRLSFSPGVNLLYGENAQGKTNVCEGIYLFARGKSFRRGTDKELLRFGEEGFHVEIGYEDRMGENLLSYTYFDNKRKRMKNGHSLRGPGEMIGSFRAVLFCPDHLRLIKDGPEERRAFLDVAIAQCTPYYLSLYTDYKKALEQRNCLLRQACGGMYYDAEELYAWSKQLSLYAAGIYLCRQDYIERIGTHAARFCEELSCGRDVLSLSYLAGIRPTKDRAEAEAEYLRLFTEGLERECAAGTTLFGITREDMDIKIGEHSARGFASQGQQRSAVLALKLAEGEVCAELGGEAPVFLFDDVLSELDERRRSYLLSEHNRRQMIITSCEKGEIERVAVTKYLVEGGRFTRI